MLLTKWESDQELELLYATKNQLGLQQFLVSISAGDEFSEFNRAISKKYEVWPI